MNEEAVYSPGTLLGNDVSVTTGNASSPSPWSPGAARCTWTVLRSETTLVVCVALLENCAVLGVLCAVPRRRRTNTHLLLTALTANDLASSGALLTGALALSASCGAFARHLACRLLGWLAMTLVCLSLHLVAVMNIERYYAICRPLAGRMRRRTLVAMVISGAVVVATVLGLPLVGVGRPYRYYKDNKICGFHLGPGSDPTSRALVTLCAGIGIAWLAVTAGCNVAIGRRLRRRGLELVQRSGVGAQQLRRVNSYATVAKVVTVVNCLLNLPFYVKLLVSVGLARTRLDATWDAIPSLLWILTAVVNPILYVACNKSYRQTAVACCLCRQRRRGSSATYTSVVWPEAAAVVARRTAGRTARLGSVVLDLMRRRKSDLDRTTEMTTVGQNEANGVGNTTVH